MPFAPGKVRLRSAVAALRCSNVIASPTEAVWGLSCDPLSKPAVMRLLALKNRPVEKGLILVAATMDQLDFLLSDLAPAQRDQLDASWPGPVTWLVPHRDRLPSWVFGEHDTVAVRVSNHPVVRALCLAWGGPLVSTSANPAGCQPARASFQVRRYFRDSLGDLLPGAVGTDRRPTSIRSLSTGQIIRA